MQYVTIKRARGGYVVETEEPDLIITARLSEALRIVATHLSHRPYFESEVGDVIILSPEDATSDVP
jgi:hypothetical protein